MDFSLSQEQEMFRQYVRKYLQDVETTKIARDYIHGDINTVQQSLAGLNELGCTQLNIPEQYDGMGLGKLDLVPIFEELGAALVPGLHLETLALAAPMIEQFGSDEQKQTYLPSIASAEATFTIAWLEPGRSYKKQGIQLQAQHDGGSLLLQGVKTLVPDVELATHIIVPVRVNEQIALVIVESDTAGLTVSPLQSFDETRKLSQLQFDNVRVSTNQVIGQLDEGWAILNRGLLSFNAGLSSWLVGATERIVQMANEYAQIREQFGNPIGRFQAIKHRIVDMKLDLETARSLSYYANWTLETDAPDKVEAIVSARIFATQTFMRAAADNIQIHGGIGFTEEIDCHLYVKRSRFFENYLGDIDTYYDLAIDALGWTDVAAPTALPITP